jgi:hypothetical protein
MDPKNLNIGRPSTYAASLEKIIERQYVQLKDLEGKKIQVSRYNAKKTDSKQINIETKDLVIGKEKNKLVPTKLGRDVTDFLQKNFEMLMDYKFTANMEKELDDIAEGDLNNIKVIKAFYDYVMKCMGAIKYVDKPIQNQGISLGTSGELEITLLDGQFGKYIRCGTFKINLEKIMTEMGIDESKLDNKKTKKLLCEKVIEKMDEPDVELTSNLDNNSKIWTIKNMKYTLKSGQYGYFVESFNTKINKKMKNYSLKFLITKKAKDADILLNTDKDHLDVINLITEEDIQSVIDYNKEVKTKEYEKKTNGYAKNKK